jgi:hypothetical protein
MSGAVVVLADDGAAQAPTEESLRQTVSGWQENLFAEDATTRFATVDAMWPTPEDVAALFPKDADRLNRLLGAIKRKTKERFRVIPDEVLARERGKSKSVREITTINVRTDDASRSHVRVLQMIPAEVPVFRIVTRYQRGAAGSSSYIYVNDHWVHFRDFSSIPDILPELDQVLERLPER